MTLDTNQASALAAHLLQGSRYIDTTSEPVQIAVDVLHAVGLVRPDVGAVLDRVLEALTHKSFVVPGPGEPVVLISRDDAALPQSFAETAVELAVHASQMRRLGAVQSLEDYLLTGELRAVYSAHAWLARAFARHLFTGELPSAQKIIEEYAVRALLPLDANELAMARGILASGLATIAEGLRPPIAITGALLTWLRTNAPEAIVPTGWVA